MGSMLGSVGYVGHMKKKEKLKKVLVVLKNGVTITGVECELAWAVIKQAVLDVDWSERNLVTLRSGKKKWYIDRSHDSTGNIVSGGLDFWFDVVGLDKTFVRRVFQHFRILKDF